MVDIKNNPPSHRRRALYQRYHFISPPEGQPYAASINASRCNGRARRVRAMPSRAAPEPCSPASDLRPFQLPGALCKASIRVLFPSSPLNMPVLYYAMLNPVKYNLRFSTHFVEYYGRSCALSFAFFQRFEKGIIVHSEHLLQLNQLFNADIVCSAFNL